MELCLASRAEQDRQLKRTRLTLSGPRFISIVCLPLASSAAFTGLSELPRRRREGQRVPHVSPQLELLP